MAILKDGLEFTGSVGKLTAYKIKGSDKIILRAKGGASKARIKHSPVFERTRKQNMEFGGLAKAVSGIRMALIPVRHLTIDNFTPRLTSLCRNIQQQDKTNRLGERGVCLSADGHLLEGFRLNKENCLADVLTSPLAYSIDRETKKAVIHFPRLVPGINLHLPWKQPAFRFIIGLGAAIDIAYQEERYNSPDLDLCPFTRLDTGWYPAGESVAAQSLEVQLSIAGPLADFQTLILSVGIEMGRADSPGHMAAVKHAGAASVLAVK